MEGLKLVGYFRVERSTFLDEHFYSRQNSIYITESGVYSYTHGGQTHRAEALDCVFYKKGSYYDRRVLEPVVLHIFDVEGVDWENPEPVRFSDRQRLRADLALLSSLSGAVRENLGYIEHLLRDILYLHHWEQVAARDQQLPTDTRIAQALAVIRSNFHREISLEEVAREVHLSYPHFNRLFGKTMHISPMAYIHKLRAAKAKELLHTTDLPIKVVAAECGFRDIYYFSNFFKAATGVSPKQYRETNWED